MQHSPEQSSLLSSSHVWANGSSGPAASLDAQNTDLLSALDAFRDREGEKNQRAEEVLLKLHCVCIYFSNIYSHSEQFHYNKETISSLH